MDIVLGYIILHPSPHRQNNSVKVDITYAEECVCNKWWSPAGQPKEFGYFPSHGSNVSLV